MREIKYGLISETDWGGITKTLDAIIESTRGVINTLEIGLYSGLTSKAICEYVRSKGRFISHTGIDNGKDGEDMRDFPQDATFIKGNSNEVYYSIPDESQDFIFIDGLHTFSGVVSDVYCYAPKVKYGGWLILHDTGRHIQPFTDWQETGSKDDPDQYISVLKAVQRMCINFLNNEITTEEVLGDCLAMAGFFWQLVYNRADEDNNAGGVVVFKKLDQPITVKPIKKDN